MNRAGGGDHLPRPMYHLWSGDAALFSVSLVLTEGVAEAIAANTKPDKVFIGNIHRDFDIQGDDASDLARKLLKAMSAERARAMSTGSTWYRTSSCRASTKHAGAGEVCAVR